jgi:DNA-binding CsgD family transcriptional regulator
MILFWVILAIMLALAIALISYRLIQSRAEIQSLHRQISELEDTLDQLSTQEQISGMAMNIIQKNEMLAKLQRKISKYLLRSDLHDSHFEFQELDRIVKQTLQLDKDRDTFELFIEQANQGFYQRLKEMYPSLSDKEQRLAALIRLNLSTKEIADVLNITAKSVEINRYRMRKKIQLPSSESLSELIKKI